MAGLGGEGKDVSKESIQMLVVYVRVFEGCFAFRGKRHGKKGGKN